jgi:hypothetical protein
MKMPCSRATSHRLPALLTCAFLAALSPRLPAADAPLSPLLDTLSLANPASESAHRLSASRSYTLRGGLDEPARILLPLEPQTCEGGRLTFTMKRSSCALSCQVHGEIVTGATEHSACS